MTKAELEITELLKLLAEKEPPSGEGWTTRELMELTGWNEKRVHGVLRRGIAEGLIYCAGKKPVKAIDGHWAWAPAYAPKKK
jgi:predicted transcriptional regulator